MNFSVKNLFSVAALLALFMLSGTALNAQKVVDINHQVKKATPTKVVDAKKNVKTEKVAVNSDLKSNVSKTKNEYKAIALNDVKFPQEQVAVLQAKVYAYKETLKNATDPKQVSKINANIEYVENKILELTK